MLSNHSPEKQNRSPSPTRLKPKRFNQKINNSQNDLFSFHINDEATNGELKLNSLQHNYHSQFKLMGCLQDKEMARLKAMLSDKQFELKKLDQDFAQYKLLSRMQREKATKKLREQVQVQRKRHNEQIQKWELKFQETVARHELQLWKYKNQIQIYYQRDKESQLNDMQQKYESELKIKEVKMQVLQKQMEIACKNIKQQYQLHIQELILAHQRQKQQLKNVHHQEIKKTQQHFEVKVLAVECQKQAEVKLVEETKKTNIKKEEKLLTQIGLIQREKKSLWQKNDELQMRCKVLAKRYDSKQEEIKTLISQYQAKIYTLNQQLEKIKKETQSTIQVEKIKILKDQYQKTQKIYDKLLKLQQLKDKSIQYHRRNQKLLQYKFQRRESRREDVEIIKEIQGELAYKEKEANQLYQNLKIIQLEKQNDDKIYTRIFTANRKKRKSSASRNDRDIYSLFKQSHTTDFRHLLKIHKKDEKQAKETKR